MDNALQTSKLSKEGIEFVCKKGLDLYNKSKVEPGQAVGIVTAQSIGEPVMQDVSGMGRKRLDDTLHTDAHPLSQISNICFERGCGL